MDRRLAGALLVVAVLAVAIVVPARNGLRSAGTATMIALPAAPVVGDCLLKAPIDFWTSIETARAGIRTGHSARVSPAATKNPLAPLFGPCPDQQIAGEVVGILSAEGTAADRRQSAAARLDCRTSALEYAGLKRSDDRFAPADPSAADAVTWRFSINLRGTWVPPSPVLQAAGHSWVACVAAPADGSLYAGTLADAYRSGRLPDAFGACWDRIALTASVRSVSCAQPHGAELISSGVVVHRSRTTAAAIRAECRRLAARVMGRADPNAGGGLTVEVAPDTEDGRVPIDNVDSLDVTCFVASPAHSLTGTLVGVGEGPIPYAG